jgi:glycerol-3-phosphate dehydrogenase subunit B
VKRHVVIVGAGVAGLAAAYAARERGANVTLVSAGVGASALGSGAIDDTPWEAWYAAARTLDEPLRSRAVPDDVRAFVDALGVWDLPAADTPAPLVATAAGRLRPARGRDRGLLDLSSLRQTTVLIPRLSRAAWDADALAATLQSEWLARRADLQFLPVDASIFRFTEETRISDIDLAMRHDEPARLVWLAERLRELIARFQNSAPPVGAILLGSWLGIQQERATDLSARVGIPVGEVLVGVGSSAGLRLEAAMQRLIDRLALKYLNERVASLRQADKRFEVVLTNADVIAADAVVLALGGVASGGILYSPPDLRGGEDMPSEIASSFTLGVVSDFPLPLAWKNGDRVDAGSSVFGPPLDTTAWPEGTKPSTLESVGLEARNGQVCPGVYAAGDLVAGERRTVLTAIASGLRAGRMV